ncbi:hypothetical protein AM593_05616, partial [Mytilus galloprovincialis]
MVAELKFENVKLTRKSDNSGEAVVISMDLTGLNQIEYNRGYMSLNDAVKEAVKRMTCTTNNDPKESSQSQLSQGTSSSSASSTGIIAEIKGQYRAPPNVNKGYNEYTVEDTGN